MLTVPIAVTPVVPPLAVMVVVPYFCVLMVNVMVNEPHGSVLVVPIPSVLPNLMLITSAFPNPLPATVISAPTVPAVGDTMIKIGVILKSLCDLTSTPSEAVKVSLQAMTEVEP